MTTKPRKACLQGTVRELKDWRGKRTGKVEVSIAGFDATSEGLGASAGLKDIYGDPARGFAGGYLA